MGLRKRKKLRTMFIEYIVFLGIFIVILIIVNYLMFAITSIGVYPANYSEKVIQKNFDELKNSPKVTMDLLTPMCSFGVYSENGDFLYGNFPLDDREANWDSYIQGRKSIGSSGYNTGIEREEGVLIVSYPLTMQFTSDKLRRIMPNAEATIVFSFLLQLIIIIIFWSNRFVKKVNNELRNLLIPMEKIENQDLDFDIGTSNIEDIDIVLQGIDMMKDSLKVALEEQWFLEQQKKEQISALAHDIKTPLTIVKGNAGLLKETDMTEEQKNYCNYIEESSLQMEGYLQRLLSITKEELDTNESNEIVYISKLMNSLKSQGEAIGKIEGVDIVWNIDVGEDVYVLGNELELERALMNIIANAVDFSPSNSTIDVDGYIDNSELVIEVKDQGQGFSNKMLKYGKEQFFMENESRTKTGHHGLGLYIANTLITRYNGELILSNKKNGGGLVTVKIPL